MNHRRSVAAVALVAAVAFAACGEADTNNDQTATPGRRNANADQVEADRAQAQAEFFYNQENAAVNDPQAAFEYYYDVTHPAPRARGPVSINQAERAANFEARLAEAAAAAAARGPVSANQAEHRATVEVTVEHEELRRGVDIRR